MKIQTMRLILWTLVGGALPLSGHAETSLDQGWNSTQITAWLETSAGSRILPLSWAVALERPQDSQLMLTEDWVAKRYHMHMRDMTSLKLSLPQGLSVDVQDDTPLVHTNLRWKVGQSSQEPWLGVTCSACHTSQISYGGQHLTVYGGSTRADFIPLLEDLSSALLATQSDSNKFARFASKVLGNENTLTNQELLRTAIGKAQSRLAQFIQLTPSGTAPGPGRQDAFGAATALLQMASSVAQPIAHNNDGPTNPLFLWNVEQFDKTLSNGMAPNLNLLDVNGRTFDVGFLAGNVGVLLAILADIDVPPFASMLPVIGGYPSSVRMDNLLRIDDQITQLKAPRWPSEIFGAPSPDQVALGEKLYKDQGCAACHQLIARDDLRSRYTVPVVPLKASASSPAIGTDPWDACNTYLASAPTGNFFGQPVMPFFSLSNGGLYGTEARQADTGVTLAVQIVVNKAIYLPGGVAEAFLGGLFGINTPPSLPTNAGPPWIGSTALASNMSNRPAAKQTRLDLLDDQPSLQQCMTDDHRFLGYRARPLNGVWATGPFLHNASVPSLYDLLLPPEQRPKSFYVGSTAFDPVKVGYVTTPSDDNSFLFDTQLRGNSNAGHDFGNALLTDSQRWALVAYLKTL